MDNKTLSYISRRMKDELSQPEFEEHRISARYEGTWRKEPDDEKSEAKEKDDFLYAMEESLEDEIDDVVKFSEMAMEAENNGHKEYADGFYSLAKEKLECAEYIRLRLIKHGEYDPKKQSEIEEKLDRAKHLFRRL